MRLIWTSPVLLLCACTFGNGQICGPQTPQVYCDKEAYEKLMYPKPYGARWIKEGMTKEQRREDSWACGAARTTIGADGPVFDRDQLEKERLPEDKDDIVGPHGRLTDRWSACMQSKGYVFLKECDSRCMYP
jgi:hypothetical protein